MFLLSILDRSCKWITSITVFIVAITFTTPDNVTVAIYVAASLVNAMMSKLLKRIINEARPAGTRHRPDPGMPSGHAMSLAYLSAAAARALSLAPVLISPLKLCLLQVLVVGLGVFFMVLRVQLGHHTVPQIVVGGALGYMNLFLVTQLDAHYAFCELPSEAKMKILILCVTLCVTFAVKYIRSWIKEIVEE